MSKHHCDCENNKNIDKIKHKIGKFKYLFTKKFKACNANIQDLTSVTSNIKDLTVETINGEIFPPCVQTFKDITGDITPLVYSNGEPIKPENTKLYNQELFDLNWFLILAYREAETEDFANGRVQQQILNDFYCGNTICPPYDLSGCECPLSGYSIFNGSITENVLTVESLVSIGCTGPEYGTINQSDSIYGFSIPIVSSLIGEPSEPNPGTGGTGTYFINNKYDDYKDYPLQKMLSLSLVGNCIKTPLRAYGVELLPFFGEPGSCGGPNTLKSLSYNLYLINSTASTRMASVLVSICYLDENGTQVETLAYDLKQIEPSISYFGETFTNTIQIPPSLTKSIVTYNATFEPFVSLTVYVEDGVNVFVNSLNPNSNIQQLNKTSLKTIIKPRAQTTTSNQLSAIYSSTESLQKEFIIPDGAKSVTFNGFGAGGGGGNGASLFDAGGGGGGGSGFPISETDIKVDLTKTPYDKSKKINVILGLGGKSDKAGSLTIVTFFDENNKAIQPSFQAQGGGPGNTPKGFIAGDGGNGYYGGGGGGGALGVSTGAPGKGGKGLATKGCPNGDPGMRSIPAAKLNGDGGQGGAPICGQGGKKGYAQNFGADNYISAGGGGGGGFGGGTGGGGTGRIYYYYSLDATQSSAGGGGAKNGDIVFAIGGKGGNGSFTDPTYTF